MAWAGLQWEQKVAGSGCEHCVDDTYMWSSSGTAPDGDAFTSFLATLNNCTDDPVHPIQTTGVIGAFAGHCDWRLPTIVELWGLLLSPCPGGATPCIDPIFGPTQTFFGYWSSTSADGVPSTAWDVTFSTGYIGNDPKTFAGGGRVRGGAGRLVIDAAGPDVCRMRSILAQVVTGPVSIPVTVTGCAQILLDSST
jgi:hypothetical protein